MNNNVDNRSNLIHEEITKPMNLFLVVKSCKNCKSVHKFKMSEKTHIILNSFEHIGVQILSNLDLESLLECRLVDKTWNKFIDSKKYLWKVQLKKFIDKGCNRKASDCTKQWIKVFKYFDRSKDINAENLRRLICFAKYHVLLRTKIKLVENTSCNVRLGYKCPINVAFKFGDEKIIELILSCSNKGIIKCCYDQRHGV